MSFAGTALLLCDLQNDFIHVDGAYGRAKLQNQDIAALPARLLPLVRKVSGGGGFVIATHFTLVPGRDGEPLISTHLKKLRPFIAAGDFAPGSWGQQTVEILQPVDFAVEKIAYSAFYMTRLEWLLRRLEVSNLIVGGIVTNGGVASTVRDAQIRDFSINLLEDGCAAFDRTTHETAIAALKSVCTLTSISAVLGHS